MQPKGISRDSLKIVIFESFMFQGILYWMSLNLINYG